MAEPDLRGQLGHVDLHRDGRRGILDRRHELVEHHQPGHHERGLLRRGTVGHPVGHDDRQPHAGADGDRHSERLAVGHRDGVDVGAHLRAHPVGERVRQRGAQRPVEVAVTDIGKVAVGQEVSVSDATGGTSEGSVGTIALLPTSGATTYTVSVVVAEPAAGLVAGTSANLTITVASSADALLAPISAITLTGSDSGTVRVVSDGQVSTQDVTLGIRGTTHVEVTDGLAGGDTLVLSDTSEAIPTSDSSTSSMGGGMGGGSSFGGGSSSFGGGSSFSGGSGPQR